MAFLPPFGMINPLPTVNHNDFQEWMRGYKTRKQPFRSVIKGTSPQVLVGYAPAGPVRLVWLRFFLSPAGRDFLRRYEAIRRATLAPGRISPKRSSEELFNDIQRFLREQAKNPRPRGLAYIRPQGNRGGVTSQPWPATLAYAMAQLMTSRPTERETDEERDKPLDMWFERRYGRTHPARYIRRYGQ